MNQELATLLTNLAQLLDEIKTVHRPVWWSEYHDQLRSGITAALRAALKHEDDRLRTTLRAVRAYIANCDHQPAVDEIDAALKEP